MKKLFGLIFISALMLVSCVKEADTTQFPDPVISFYPGVDGWTHQPTFIYTDTTINGAYKKYIKANFAAAATIKHMLVKVDGAVVFDKEAENETKFNEEFLYQLDPLNLGSTTVLEYELVDYAGKRATRKITVHWN